MILCLNYIYYGKLTGVNTTCVELTDAGIVYQTGEWNLPEWKNFQKLPFEKTFVKVDAIESYGQVDKTKK